ncbi:MAG: hypothetical protein ACFFF4_00450 [Candidatus Thorarchaeota archaeon]
MKKEVLRSVILVTCLSLLLSLPLMCSVPLDNDYLITFGEKSLIIPSTEVWSDNFNDGNISDWTIFGLNTSADPPTDSDQGDFSVDDGSLRANGTVWNNVYIESTTAYGTWSFDVDVVDTPAHHFYVGFMSTTNYSDVYEVYDYALMFVTDSWEGYAAPTIVLGWHRHTPNADSVDWDPFAYAIYPSGLDGWYHIDITRDEDDFFYVYVNETYSFGLTHDTYTESETFHFWAQAGPAIDNIVVDDTTLLDEVPPVFSRAFADKSIIAGENFRYDVNATDSSGIDTATWSVNDTTNFAINSDGVITNAVTLGVGTYGIEVSIDDTWGNTATGSFAVTVQAAPIDYTLIAIAAGLGIVALVVCVVCLKKRGS